MSYLKSVALPVVLKEIEKGRYDFFPPQRLCPAMRELYRAMTVVADRIDGPKAREEFKTLRDGITFFFQEDDSYRFRVQWIAQFFSKWWNPLTCFEYGMNILEHAEIIGDMKERIRLWRRIFLLVLRDKQFKDAFLKFFKECDWKKVRLSEADKYFFRGKYFKVDLDKFDY